MLLLEHETEFNTDAVLTVKPDSHWRRYTSYDAADAITTHANDSQFTQNDFTQ